MWSRRNRQADRPGARGFVLLEVLVAAAVAAVLLVAVMRIFSSAWSTIGTIREDANAMLIARSVIAASAPRNDLAAGTQEGTTGRYAWMVSISGPSAEAAASAAAATAAATQQPQDGQQTSSNLDSNGQDNDNNQNGQNGSANTGPPWGLFQIVVAVRAPSGRRTVLETYRLSRPSH